MSGLPKQINITNKMKRLESSRTLQPKPKAKQTSPQPKQNVRLPTEHQITTQSENETTANIQNYTIPDISSIIIRGVNYP